MKLYVAYGSNLNKKQMKYRCPGATVAFTGILQNWELVYRGSKTGSYASIRRKKGNLVPVAVWNISDVHERTLDVYEGYPRFYGKQNVYVTLQDGSKRKTMVYIMNKFARPGKPSTIYINTIKEGYLDNDLNLSHLCKSIQKNEQEIS